MNRNDISPSGILQQNHTLQKAPARILCVEDCDGDYFLVEQYLRDAAFDHKPTLHRATTLAQGLVMLSTEDENAHFDVILLDLSLPDSFGPDTYYALQKAAPHTAVTILSGNTDHELALAMVQSGAQDYLPKDALSSDLLMRSVLYAVERQRMRTGLEKLNDKLKRATSELRSAQMQLIQAEKLESLGRLSAGVAHEVKNPLGVLQMGVDYLKGQQAGLDANGIQVLTYMQDAITRADTIIYDMLNFSRSDELEMRPLCVNTLTEAALRMVNHDLLKRKVKVITEFTTSLPPTLADHGKLEQVLINLLMNAAQAMPEGGLLKVRTYCGQIEEIHRNEGLRHMERLHQGDEVVVIEVRDHGPGIPEDMIGHIFEPFFTTKPTGEGTGLGLSVAKRIVELHSGNLQISNVDNPLGVRVRVILKADTKFSLHPEHNGNGQNNMARATALPPL